jgi:hypothetical protein
VRDELTLAELYPPVLRASLVNWAGAAGPDELPPPDAVRDHLEPKFRTAARRGRWAGLRWGLLPWLVAIMTYVALLQMGPST